MKTRSTITLAALLIIGGMMAGNSIAYAETVTEKIDSTITFLNSGATAGKISAGIKKSLVDSLNIAKSNLAGSDASSAGIPIDSALAVVGSSRAVGGLIDNVFASDLEARLNDIRSLL